MIDIAVLKAMAAAGATVDVIIAAVDAAQQAEQREQAARRAKEVERKRAWRVRGKDGTSADSEGHPRTVKDKRKVSTPSKENTSVSNETAEDPERGLFRRGKEVLGETSGGLVAKLLKARKRNIALARADIETASTKENAREWIGRIVNGHEHKTDDWRSAIV